MILSIVMTQARKKEKEVNGTKKTVSPTLNITSILYNSKKTILLLMLLLLLYSFTTNSNASVNILNPGFEYPDISGYVYEPSGTDWSHSGGGFVLADSGSAFGNTAYQGGQNMVMQNVVSVWQDISGFEIGKSYKVSWAEASRPSAGGNDIRIWIDTSVVGSLHTVTDTNWKVKTSDTFEATSTTHTLKFETLNSAGGDRSVFIDTVSITQTGPLLIATNPSPLDGAEDVPPATSLGWRAGTQATSHNIYLGTSSGDVNQANRLAGDINCDGPTDWRDIFVMSGQWLNGTGNWAYNPVAYWKFNEGSGTTAADSAGNNNATIYGPNWVTGKVGSYALDFNGVNDYAEVADDDSLDFGADDSFTVSAWIRTSKNDVSIIDKRRIVGSVWYEGYSVWIFMDKVTLIIKDTGNKSVYRMGTTAVIDDKWHHIAAVRNASENKLYVYLDGVSDAVPTTDTTTATFENSENLLIGKKATNGFFDGIIDDITIYNRALEENDIAALAQGNYNADLDYDGVVNMVDFAILANTWQQPPDPEYKGSQNNEGNNIYDVGLLNDDQIYYWRIDEVNGPNVWKGDIWSFTTEYDLGSDTWVTVDDLGRELPGYAECGPARSDRYVGIFYFIWLGEHGTGGPYDITKLLATDPYNPAWGPAGDFHHWGESELGYYLSDDEYVIRKHAHMLADAGVDTLIFDVTNAWTYKDNYMALCDVFSQIRAEGGVTPQICFMANSYGDDVAQDVYDDLYSQNLYPDLWFYWKGKPLILAPLDGMVVNNRTINHSQEVLDFFTMRYCWTWITAGYDTWKWMDYYPQQYSWHESSSIPEQISVSAGIVPHANQGRSYQNGTQPAHDEYGLTGTEEQGLCFAEQWTRLNQIDPEFLFITGWNEWVAERQIAEEGRWFLGEQLSAGDTWFVDLYNHEYSRDIEPMRNGHTDNYYYQMIDGIRRFKGVSQSKTGSQAKTIVIDGDFSDWRDVDPRYRDWIDDTLHRNHPGWGSAGTYTNTTGRNDFITAKVARDSTYIYFYIETANDITSYTNPNWMLLFINSDQDYADGWEGYDYVVNLTVNSSTSTTLKGTSGGWNWTNVDSSVPYRVSGNKMEIRIDSSDIGQGSGSSPVAFDFHLADNIQQTNDIIEFSVSGDSAPGRRFNYRYKTD